MKETIINATANNMAGDNAPEVKNRIAKSKNNEGHEKEEMNMPPRIGHADRTNGAW